MLQSFSALVAFSKLDGAALASSTAQTTILPDQGIGLLPGGTLVHSGQYLRIEAFGRMSTVVTTPGTLTFTFKVGAVNAAVTSAIPLNVTAQTNASWSLEWNLYPTVVGGGTKCTLMHVAKFFSRGILGSPAAATGPGGVIVLPDTAPAVGTGFDSTASQTVDLQATWSVSSASNSILCHGYTLELKN